MHSVNKRRNSSHFPKNFLWGTATASYQVEGAVNEEGRGQSIWDSFSHTPGKIALAHTGDIAVDQYHRYPEDIRLMREAGLNAYRFSLAWPRIQAEGSGPYNQKGFDYYKRLSEELRRNNISAVATLYHWDLPQALEDAGGWPNRDTAYRFAEYSRSCFHELKDHIDMWITLNEAWSSVGMGHLSGIHAPGRTDRSSAWAAGHHLLLGHGLTVQAYRSEFGTAGDRAPIGISHNLLTPRPASQSQADREAADRAMDLPTRFFLDPLLGNPYPERHFKAYPQATPPPVKEGDMGIIAEPVDFLGLNYYFEPVIASAPVGPLGDKVDTVPCHPEGYREVLSYQSKTEMDWPVTPRGLFRQLRWVWDHSSGRYPLYITENGCAFRDELSPDGRRCHDPLRIEYLRDHFTAALDAVEEGVDLRGYFIWSTLDNFEWACGYTKRFGLVYVDYVNQRRVPKDSYYYVRECINGYEEL